MKILREKIATQSTVLIITLQILEVFFADPTDFSLTKVMSTIGGSSEQCVEAKRPGQDTNVTIKLTDLKLFSHGVYSNVYTGLLDKTVVAVKKCWSQEEENLKEVRILKRLNKYKARNIVNLLYVFSKSYDDKVSLFFKTY